MCLTGWAKTARGRPGVPRLAVALALLGVGFATAAATPTVFLDPASVMIAPGDETELVLEINADADTFANFQVIFRFDPDVVEFVEATEGLLYTETGLPTWFFAEEESLGTWEVFDVLLHGQSFIVAPGELARLRFRGIGIGVSSVEFLSVIVTDRDRVRIDPLLWQNGIIFVDDVTAVASSEAGGESRWRLGPPTPNPTRGSTTIAYRTPAEAARGVGRFAVYDPRGRLVRLLVRAPGRGESSLVWDGRTDRGEEAPAGVYFVRWETPAGPLVRSVVLVR